jgi:hypothetical protein
MILPPLVFPGSSSVSQSVSMRDYYIICPNDIFYTGESLAKAEIFLYLTGLLQVSMLKTFCFFLADHETK